MKIKNLRWWVLSLVVIITIINYLDRGTLNYMWVANTKMVYTVVQESNSNNKLPYAVYQASTKQYQLFNADGTDKTVNEKK